MMENQIRSVYSQYFFIQIEIQLLLTYLHRKAWNIIQVPILIYSEIFKIQGGP